MNKQRKKTLTIIIINQKFKILTKQNQERQNTNKRRQEEINSKIEYVYGQDKNTS